MVVDKRLYKYGQWDVEILLDDVYTDNTKYPELFCRIYCTGTWESINGSMWETWDCAKYDNPYALSENMRDEIIRKCRKMFQDYRKKNPVIAN